MTVVLGHRPMPQLESARQQRDVKSIVLSCNKDAMECLQNGQQKASFEQLKYAEALLIASPPDSENTTLLTVTCNNLGTYYKKTGKYHGALSYLRRALKLEEDLRADEITLAGTHLNICAVLSKLEKHDKALEHASSALAVAEHRGEATMTQEEYSVLVMAHHSAAVEHNHLGDSVKAMAAYRKGYEIAKRCLGENHPLAISLGQNCEDELRKSRKPAPISSTQVTWQPYFTQREAELPPLGGPLTSDRTPFLPVIVGASPQDAGETRGTGEMRQEAADWVAAETNAWEGFAQSALHGTFERTQAPPSPATATLRHPPAPAAPRQPQPPSAQSLSAGPLKFSAPSFVGRTTLSKTLDEHPEVLRDIIQSDSEVRFATGAHVAPLDCRPHRQLHGATRTAKVVRRTCTRNPTRHRDLMISGQASTLAEVQLGYKRKAAAERIQRAWRAWYKYCQHNHDWMTTTYMAAAMIQSKWRSHNTRQLKMERGATCIQRHMRGCLVRMALKRHRAAVAIQRHMAGVLTRMQMLRMRIAATKIQSLARGAAARRRVRAKRTHLNAVCTTIQCALRQHFARRRVGDRRSVRIAAETRERAAGDIQRAFRGYEGRIKVEKVRLVREHEALQKAAAIKLQAMARRHFAIKRVDRIRAAKLRSMHEGVTRIARMWKGVKARRRYETRRSEFKKHEGRVRTIQRYMRGCLVRMRMWRAAVNAEREVWATGEIQRVWRGYVGRVRWESKFEQLWCQEMAARKLQGAARGWLARCMVGRMRRKIARHEFERARRRFRAAGKMQALVRGVLSRKRTDARRALRVHSITCIQRWWRGYSVRQVLWAQVTEIRATVIQAVARGFLVRNRRWHLTAVAICIQRAWRNWHQKPLIMRSRAIAAREERHSSAKYIQSKVRARAEQKAVARIHSSEGQPTDAEASVAATATAAEDEAPVAVMATVTEGEA